MPTAQDEAQAHAGMQAAGGYDFAMSVPRLETASVLREDARRTVGLDEQRLVGDRL